MGLDIVELFMNVEELFEITFTHEQAERSTTAGALHDVVVGKLGNRRQTSA